MTNRKTNRLTSDEIKSYNEYLATRCGQAYPHLDLYIEEEEDADLIALDHLKKADSLAELDKAWADVNASARPVLLSLGRDLLWAVVAERYQAMRADFLAMEDEMTLSCAWGVEFLEPAADAAQVDALLADLENQIANKRNRACVVKGWPAWATVTEQASQRGADEARALVEGPAVVAYVRDTAPAARTVAGMLAALKADEATRRSGYLNILEEVGTDSRLMNLATLRGLRVVTL